MTEHEAYKAHTDNCVDSYKKVQSAEYDNLEEYRAAMLDHDSFCLQSHAQYLSNMGRIF